MPRPSSLNSLCLFFALSAVLLLCSNLTRQIVQKLKSAQISLLSPLCNSPAAVKQTGQKFKGEMSAKIEKWQEPPPAKTSKPLPAPDAEVKKRRGGRRLRKMKERYGLTDVSGRMHTCMLSAPCFTALFALLTLLHTAVLLSHCIGTSQRPCPVAPPGFVFFFCCCCCIADAQGCQPHEL
jgi:hypothetical protein